MEEFIPGQRWVSSTEPELGLGLVLEAINQRVTLVFLAAAEKRTYALGNTPLTRVVFTVGDSIESNDNVILTVCSLSEKQGIISYVGINEDGVEVHLEEIDLNHHLQFNKPQDRLFSGQFDPGSWYSLRYQTWQHLQWLQQNPVRGLIGSRTSLIPHQLYIAHEAAARSAPRVMLADEVGLGKTIEAGLILQHRLINQLSHRVLILVPESLLHQWLVEMIRRFNLRFSIFDEQRCIEIANDNPFDTEQLMLCSQEFFSEHSHRQQQALQSVWDLVIVDEAHHLQWDEQNPSSEYCFVEQLAQFSPGLILLTATPEQMGIKSHFARLRLLDPDRFYGFSDFIEEQVQFEPVAKAAELLLQNQALDSALHASLKRLLKHDHVEDLLKKLTEDADTTQVRQQLINILLDHHGTGRILFRNSRQTVKGFPERRRHAYPLNIDDHTHLQTHENVLNKHPKFSWLLDKMTSLGDQKALLICKHAHMALDLSETIKKTTGLIIPVFHEGLSIVERDRAAAWFADEENNVPLLICSEIGSEGRNFQFVHHLILFDLPENPDLLQQRIGRLDRIGQKHIIDIHIPYIKATSEDILFRWYDQGLDAFRSNCSAAQHIYTQQHEQIQCLFENNHAEQVEAFIQTTIQLRKQKEQELHQGRDHLLELNSCRLQDAEKLINDLQEIDQGEKLWEFMDQVADCYGIETEFHSTDCYILMPGNHMRIANFPELPADGLTMTTNRNIALAREDMQFITWEHPMLIAAMDLVISSDTGNAAVSVVKHDELEAGQFMLEILFIVECSAPANLQIGRFLPPTPMRILIDQNNQDLSAAISHQSFIETADAIEKHQVVEFLSAQKEQLNKMIAVAQHKAEQQVKVLVHDSSMRMLETLGNEIKRLVRLKKVNPNIKQQEIDQLKEKTKQAHANITAAKLKLDAVRFIIVS